MVIYSPKLAFVCKHMESDAIVLTQPFYNSSIGKSLSVLVKKEGLDRGKEVILAHLFQQSSLHEVGS